MERNEGILRLAFSMFEKSSSLKERERRNQKSAQKRKEIIPIPRPTYS